MFLVFLTTLRQNKTVPGIYIFYAFYLKCLLQTLQGLAETESHESNPRGTQGPKQLQPSPAGHDGGRSLAGSRTQKQRQTKPRHCVTECWVSVGCPTLT